VPWKNQIQHSFLVKPLVSSETNGLCNMTDNNNPNGTNDIKSNHAAFLSPSLQSGSSNATVVGSDSGSIKSWSLDNVTNISIPSPEQSPTMISGATKLPKAHSRTAVGRLTQCMGELPPLYFIDVLVESSTGQNKWEPVKSSRLKLEAIEDWLRQFDFNFTYESFPQNGATQGVVRVIFLIYEPKDGYDDVVKKQFDKTKTDPLVRVRRMVKTEQGQEERQIRCRKLPHGENFEKSKTEAFNFFLRRLLARQDYLEVLPLADDSVEQLEPELSDRSTPVDSLASLKSTLHLRIQPSVDMALQRILLDVDIVPCIPKKSLYKAVLDLIGQTDDAPVDVEAMKELLPSVVNNLRGLKVRCGYVPGKKTHDGKGQATRLTNDEMERGLGRVFRIENIIMPDPEVKFDVDGSQVSVYEYFEKSELIIVLRSCQQLTDDSPWHTISQYQASSCCR
jgi:hypothetical protein